MYTDHTVEDILESASYFHQNLNKTFEEAKEAFNYLENEYSSVLEQDFTQDLLRTTKKYIADEYCKRELFITNVNQNKETIENLECAIEKLNDLRCKKQIQCANLEQKLATLQDKINFVKKGRDKIFTYKILTKVEFIYTTKKVKGLITKQAPEYFNFNPRECSQKDISNKLWELILKE